jgi:hypothetical protein
MPAGPPTLHICHYDNVREDAPAYYTLTSAAAALYLCVRLPKCQRLVWRFPLEFDTPSLEHG